MCKVIAWITKILLHFFRILLKPFKYNDGPIVVISMHFIGDSVFTIPAIKYLLEKYPAKKIYIICFPVNVRVYKEIFGDKVEIISIDRENFLFNKRWAPFAYRKIVKKLKPEIIIDMLGSISSFSLIYGIPAKNIEGLADPLIAGYYDRFVFMKKAQTLIGGYLLAAGMKENDFKNVRNFTIKNGRDNRVLINPFGGWKAKQWNFKKFVELYNILSQDYNVSIVCQSGLIAEDIKITLLEQNVNLVETETIDEFFDYVNGCGAFISNDTGPLYIAALLGTPTFSIYGPTNPDFTKPVGDDHDFISLQLKCSPKPGKQYCFTFAGRKGCPAYECMNLLPVNLVYKSVKTFLEKNNISGKYIN